VTELSKQVVMKGSLNGHVVEGAQVTIAFLNATEKSEANALQSLSTRATSAWTQAGVALVDVAGQDVMYSLYAVQTVASLGPLVVALEEEEQAPRRGPTLGTLKAKLAMRRSDFIAGL
jgi:hypothetical protein